MATFNDWKGVAQLIEANGLIGEPAPDNPRMVKVVKYRNQGQRIAYGCVFEGEAGQDRYETASEYIHEPEVIWRYEP